MTQRPPIIADSGLAADRLTESQSQHRRDNLAALIIIAAALVVPASLVVFLAVLILQGS